MFDDDQFERARLVVQRLETNRRLEIGELKKMFAQARLDPEWAYDEMSRQGLIGGPSLLRKDDTDLCWRTRRTPPAPRFDYTDALAIVHVMPKETRAMTQFQLDGVWYDNRPFEFEPDAPPFRSISVHLRDHGKPHPTDDDLLYVERQLSDALFPPESAVDAAVRELFEKGKRLRIRLSVGGVAATLPWELASHPAADVHRVAAAMSIVRLTGGKATAVPASWLDNPSLDYVCFDDDIDGLPAVRMGLHHGHGGELRTIQPTDLDVPTDQGATILHVVRHGTRGENKKTPTGLEKPAERQDFARKIAARSPKLAVLAVCLSGREDRGTSLARLVGNAGVPNVIAMLGKVINTAHEAFAQAFYSDLVNSRSLDHAMAAGRQAMSTDQRPQVLLFQHGRTEG